MLGAHGKTANGNLRDTQDPGEAPNMWFGTVGRVREHGRQEPVTENHSAARTNRRAPRASAAASGPGSPVRSRCRGREAHGGARIQVSGRPVPWRAAGSSRGAHAHASAGRGPRPRTRVGPGTAGASRLRAFEHLPRCSAAPVAPGGARPLPSALPGGEGQAAAWRASGRACVRWAP